jgi:hypothetical protein
MNLDKTVALIQAGGPGSGRKADDFDHAKNFAGLKPGSNTAFVFDGPEDTVKVGRHREGHMYLDSGEYDQHFKSDAEAINHLQKNKYKYAGVDSMQG